MYNYFRLVYYLADLMRYTHWDSGRLKEYQNRKLRETVKYAYDHVEFYHRKFRALGLKPEDITTVEHLSKLPVMNRDEMQASSCQLMSDEFSAEKLAVASTSGSTGRPFFTYLTKREDEFRKAKLLRPHLVCGQKIRDKWVVIAPPWHSGKTSSLQRALRVFVPNIVSVFDSVSQQMSAVKKLQPDVVDGYSSSLRILAEEVSKDGGDVIRPRLTMGGAELIDEYSRRIIENAFRAPYYDQYGSEEFQMLAWQCPAKDEYHVDADTVIMQFVDETGQKVSAGERGEIVCTSLFNRAMPILRYALGDIGVPSAEKDCSCGRRFPMMKLVEGRQEELLTLRDGRRLSPLAIGDCMCAFKYFHDIAQYRFVQKKIDSFRIMVKKRTGGISTELLESELTVHVKRVLNIRDATVDVEFVGEMPPDKSGKIRKVVSEIKNK
jgi:phenylacetate-CoA ligase